MSNPTSPLHVRMVTQLPAIGAELLLVVAVLVGKPQSRLTRMKCVPRLAVLQLGQLSVLNSLSLPTTRSPWDMSRLGFSSLTVRDGGPFAHYRTAL